MDTQDLTGLLVKWGEGEKGVLDQILPAVYDELHRMAGRYLNHERVNHTLQPTALINEAYLRLVDQSRLTLPRESLPSHLFWPLDLLQPPVRAAPPTHDLPSTTLANKIDASLVFHRTARPASFAVTR